MDKLSPEVWLNRCAQRIVQVDQRIGMDEAQEIARDLHAFERTSVMTPEEAVDFAAAEIARGRTTFERRTEPRN
jgi:hypothetical protein